MPYLVTSEAGLSDLRAQPPEIFVYRVSRLIGVVPRAAGSSPTGTGFLFSMSVQIKSYFKGELKWKKQPNTC
jgi:hypothetical protein